MDEDQNNLTDTTLPDGAQLTPADGEAAVAETLTLAELNEKLGKSFKDLPTALKAVKDTFAYVGRKQEPSAQTPANADGDTQNLSALETTVRSLKDDLFYSKHPEYEDYRDLISKIGGDPAEVVGSKEFQSVFEKAQEADRNRNTKSVVQSNARIAADKSATEEAVRIANATRSSDATAAALASSLRELIEQA